MALLCLLLVILLPILIVASLLALADHPRCYGLDRSKWPAGGPKVYKKMKKGEFAHSPNCYTLEMDKKGPVLRKGIEPDKNRLLKLGDEIVAIVNDSEKAQNISCAFPKRVKGALLLDASCRAPKTLILVKGCSDNFVRKDGKSFLIAGSSSKERPSFRACDNKLFLVEPGARMQLSEGRWTRSKILCDILVSYGGKASLTNIGGIEEQEVAEAKLKANEKEQRAKEQKEIDKVKSIASQYSKTASS